MPAKAVVVTDSGGNVVQVYEVQLCGQEQLAQNPDGYFLYPELPAGPSYVRILATGYKPAVYPVNLDGNNQTIRFGQPPQAPNDICFPALSFNKPSRDRVINVKANFCNLFDADDMPIFAPFIDYLIVNNQAKANDWIARLLDNGATHIDLDLSGDYAENLGWAPRYPIPGTDWTGNIGGFKRIIDWVMGRNAIPHIHLAADGQTYDPTGMTYGWNWGMQNLPSIIAQLQDYRDVAIWNAGYDGCFPNWSRNQVQQFYTMLRQLLGDTAVLGLENNAGPGNSIGYCHFGGGGADWYLPGIAEVNLFCTELLSYPPDSNGIQQVASRMLGPASHNIESSNIGPYYVGEPRAQSINTVYYETCAYQFIRKQLTNSDVTNLANQGKFYGFQLFANGLPN